MIVLTGLQKEKNLNYSSFWLFIAKHVLFSFPLSLSLSLSTPLFLLLLLLLQTFTKIEVITSCHKLWSVRDSTITTEKYV